MYRSFKRQLGNVSVEAVCAEAGAAAWAGSVCACACVVSVCVVCAESEGAVCVGVVCWSGGKGGSSKLDVSGLVLPGDGVC